MSAVNEKPLYKDYLTYDILIDRNEDTRIVAQARFDLDKMIKEGLVCPTGVDAN